MEKPVPPTALDRFRDLVEALAAQHDHARGWRAKVAREVGITPEHMQRTLAGKAPLAWPTLFKVGAAQGLHVDFWYQGPGVDVAAWRRGGASYEQSEQAVSISEREWTRTELRERARGLLALTAQGKAIRDDEIEVLAREYIGADVAGRLARRVVERGDGGGDFLIALAQDD